MDCCCTMEQRVLEGQFFIAIICAPQLAPGARPASVISSHHRHCRHSSKVFSSVGSSLHTQVCTTTDPLLMFSTFYSAQCHSVTTVALKCHAINRKYSSRKILEKRNICIGQILDILVCHPNHHIDNSSHPDCHHIKSPHDEL